jgi:hypothetical protein
LLSGGMSFFLAEPAVAARPLNRAFTDDVWFDSVGAGWMKRTIATGARRVLLDVDWAAVEPSPPRGGVDPANPSAGQYNFSALDAVVREFAGTGIAVAFLVTDAPHWAEAPGGPAKLEAAGAWRPNARAFGGFATALARRYSGSHPDPLDPSRSLPRVRYFQAWAEANLAIHLAPQWARRHGRWVPTSPEIYRSLLNAFYSGVKRVHRDDVVITEGSAPYGDPPGGQRMRPVAFLRQLLCLRGRALTPQRCPHPAHFDALAIDPYEVARPTTGAFNPDDVSAPDLGRLTRVVGRAVALRRALPHRHKRLWVTEFSYDSNPPNPTAVALSTQARWLEESFYVFWKQGVDTVVWYLIRDQPPGAWETNYYSGVYFRDGQPKPSLEAYRFPLVIMPDGNHATVWGISPRTGWIAVQRRRGRFWKTLFRTRITAGAVFVHSLPLGLRGSFRAVIDHETSLTWRR